MNETSTYKEPVKYRFYLNPEHTGWAKNLRFMYPKLLFNFTDEEVAIMYEDWSEETLAAGWFIESATNEEMILDMLSTYKVIDGKVYRLLNEPLLTTVTEESK